MQRTSTQDYGLPGWQFSLLTLLSAAALLLLVLNMLAATETHAVQQLLGERQESVDQEARWIRLKDRMVQRLVTLASEKGDRGIATLLATHGIAVEDFTPVSPHVPKPTAEPISGVGVEGSHPALLGNKRPTAADATGEP